MASASTIPVHTCTLAGVGSSNISPGYIALPVTLPVIILSPVPHGSDIVHVPLYVPPEGKNFQPEGGVLEYDPIVVSSNALYASSWAPSTW